MRPMMLIGALAVCCGMSTGRAEVPPPASNPVQPAAVAAAMARVAAFQMQAYGSNAPTDWKAGTFFSGLAAAYRATGNPDFLRYATDWGNATKWRVATNGFLHADQICVGQTYLDLYDQAGRTNPVMIAAVQAQLEKLFHRDTIKRSEIGHAVWKEAERPFTGRNLWWWCDALYMAPPVLARMSEVSGDPKYRTLLHQLYWDTTEFLYDKKAHLFYRDESAFKAKTSSGKKVFWGRGNGWVYAGLIRTLDHLPPNDPQREKYLALFRELTQSILTFQQPDGLWRSSLNDPAWYPAPETSSTSFFCFGLLAAINRGYLDKETHLPPALRAWQGLLGCIAADGRLGYAQPVADRPGLAQPESYIDYAHGAFLLAASELYKMNLTGTEAPQMPAPTATNAATPAAATWCRHVPERMDDFAWENDLVAFRAYGPAIKKNKGKEDSGIDCWGKRVKYPIIDKWYAGDQKGVSYHKDHGEGNDFYHVGSSRGCGGLGIWVDGKILTAGPYKEWKIISRTPEQSVFELTYEYTLGERKIAERKRITIALGQRLFRVESTFTENGKPAALDIAVGVTTHDGKGKANFDAAHGWMACWETIEEHGFGTGVVIAPARVREMREIKSATPDTSHVLLLTRTDAAGAVAYAAGYGWEKAGDITTPAQWEKFLASFVP